MRISVVIPVFNDAAHLKAAVGSASQPGVDEIVLVDDGSSDGSIELCERLADTKDRVAFARHDDGGNHGAAATRNLGINVSTGDVIAFLDADDRYLPGRFDATRRILDARPDIDGVYEGVDTEYVDDEQRRWWLEARKMPQVMRIKPGIAPEGLFFAMFTGQGGAFHTNGIAFRRSLLDRTGLFNPELRMSQDTELWWRMALMGRLVDGGSERPVAARLLHGSNRIFKKQQEHAQWKQRAKAQLWRWMRRHRTSRRDREAVALSLFHDRLDDVKANRSGIGWRIGVVSVVLGVVWEWPGGLGAPKLRERLGYFLGKAFALPGGRRVVSSA